MRGRKPTLDGVVAVDGIHQPATVDVPVDGTTAVSVPRVSPAEIPHDPLAHVVAPAVVGVILVDDVNADSCVMLARNSVTNVTTQVPTGNVNNPDAYVMPSGLLPD
jgi:hypothetical protein